MNSKDNKQFIKLLKEHTTIDEDFIDTFFSKIGISSELVFNILDEDVAKYLNIQIQSLRKRLSSSDLYIENVDYKKVKDGDKVVYYINYQCFERLAMNGNTEESDAIRSYFIKLREFLMDNQKIIYQSIDENIRNRKECGGDCVHFFASNDKTNFIKQNSIVIKNKLRFYNIGRIKNDDINYYVIVRNSLLIKKFIDNKKKEFVEIDKIRLKKALSECYCNYVKKKENEDLYKDMSNLFGLYKYVEDKKNMKVYCVC